MPEIIKIDERNWVEGTLYNNHHIRNHLNLALHDLPSIGNKQAQSNKIQVISCLGIAKRTPCDPSVGYLFPFASSEQ